MNGGIVFGKSEVRAEELENKKVAGLSMHPEF
jgi:hypothetical protein